MSQSKGDGRDESGDRDLRAIHDRLRNLDEKLDTAQGRQPVERDGPDARGEAMGVAFRIATELVVGVFVGGLLGWALDRWLVKTAPILLIVGLLLGIAGGLLNSVRAARKLQDTSKRR